MSHIHICLVSKQPIPNLTTILQFRPDHVILLKTKEMEKEAQLLKDIIKQKGFDVIDEVIEAYDINNVINISESIIKKYKDCEVTLNITGGTKIGTLGTFQAFYTAGMPIFYVDTDHNKILQLFPESKQQDIAITTTISIKDYLAAYGFEVEDFVKDDTYIFKRKDLTNFLVNNVKIVKQLNYNLHSYDDKDDKLPIAISLSINDKFRTLINKLNGVSFEGNKLKIDDPLSLKYLKGIWLEEYVYMQSKACDLDDIKLNVKGKWITLTKHKPKNEFDILLSKGNRLFYISCKTSNPNKKIADRNDLDKTEGVGREYLYELDSIGDTALGLFGKRMIVSARKIEDPYIKSRAGILRIDIVDGKDIITFKENLKQWLQR